MEEQIQKNNEPKEEQNLCKCGSPTEVKPIQAGWGNTPIRVCSDPNCPCKKKKDTTGWGK